MASRYKPLTWRFWGFGAAAMVAPFYLGQWVMNTTNPTGRDGILDESYGDRARVLRSKTFVDQQVLAAANKQRLQVLLDEVKNKDDGARYRAALNGVSLGTHSQGSTIGAVAISRKPERGTDTNTDGP